MIVREVHRTGVATEILYLLAFVIAINAVSALLFILIVRRPVYDDAMNMHDVTSYASQGISTDAVRAQRNAPGPTSYLWMSLAVRLLDRNALSDARLAALISWLLLVFLTIIAVRYSRWADLWCLGLLAALTFPHSLTAMATVLTEGPALLFAFLGAIAWVTATSQDSESSSAVIWASFAALLMGLAVTSRQYFLALLPAAGLLVIFLSARPLSKLDLVSLSRALPPLALSIFPPLLLAIVWRGFTSPSMAAGTSYSNYHTGVGLALFRPADVLFYAALYLVPFSFPVMRQIPRQWKWRSGLAALLVGLAAAHFRNDLVNPGPLNSLLSVVSHIPAGPFWTFWLIAGVTVFNAIAVVAFLWKEKTNARMCAPLIFSLLMILFFIVEQFGVGGNVPFYDRYILQLAPFLGIVGFWVSPRLTRARVLVLAALLIRSHGMLWRYAFMGK